MKRPRFALAVALLALTAWLPAVLAHQASPAMGSAVEAVGQCRRAW
jgi:hypothetical protein